MFQFPACPSRAVGCHRRDDPVRPGSGAPIRTSPDLNLLGGSPRLIAACHVLHRRPAPRHPPHTLSSFGRISLQPQSWLDSANNTKDDKEDGPDISPEFSKITSDSALKSLTKSFARVKRANCPSYFSLFAPSARGHADSNSFIRFASSIAFASSTFRK